jgi:glutamate-1-semialdehyde 2,1-aminomutase
LDEIFLKHKNELACVIVEPVAGNMGVVLPKPGFLEKLSILCKQTKTVLIFDEVITGFRTCYGGYQNICSISPDLTCLGKIIGGGLPMAAVGGKREIMSLLSPEGPVYQAGTLAGNPAAAAAGIATLKILNQEKEKIYPQLERQTAWLCSKIKEAAEKLKISVGINQIGSMFTLFFTSHQVETYSDVISSSTNLYKHFFKEMFRRGIYLPPSAFEAWFVSVAHTCEDLEKTAQAAEEALLKVKEKETVSLL